MTTTSDQHRMLRRRWRQQRPRPSSGSWPSSLKANPSTVDVVEDEDDGGDGGVAMDSGNELHLQLLLSSANRSVAGAGESGVSGKMYRFQKRLDLQQQHHKCKSYRRTFGSAWWGSSWWDEVSSIGGHDGGGHSSAAVIGRSSCSSRSSCKSSGDSEEIEGRRWRWSAGGWVRWWEVDAVVVDDRMSSWWWFCSCWRDSALGVDATTPISFKRAVSISL
nr:uncharacterized protein LOC115264166 [Aedes albopictus]XP_029723428.1 uncharacterized protein LOC115264166 [Aedes albopictus]